MKKALSIVVLIVSIVITLILLMYISVFIYDILYDRSIERNSSILDISKVDKSMLDEHGYYKGSYYKWRDEGSFSYKSYTDTPSIDSDEFYINNQNNTHYVIDKINYYYCSFSSTYYPHTYPELSTRKLKKLAKSDPLAAFDLLIRDFDMSDLAQFQTNLIEAKHLTAIIHRYRLRDFPDDDDLDKYFDITPTAVFRQYLREVANKIGAESKRDRGEISNEEADPLINEYTTKIIDILYRLQNADNSWLMALSIEKLYEATGEIDKDVLCESYYKGCYFLYDLKVEHNIQCNG